MARDNNNFGGQGQPFPFGGMGMPMPIIISERNGMQQQAPPPEPPIRAQLAMGLLQLLTKKTATQVAGNDHEIREIPGQQLTDEELATFATAQHALSAYFGGKLEPDIWERQQLLRDNGVPTIQFKCLCQSQDGVVNPDCIICGGEGTMDIVLKNPHKASVDAAGNVIVGGTSVNIRRMGNEKRDATPMGNMTNISARKGRPPRSPDQNQP